MDTTSDELFSSIESRPDLNCMNSPTSIAPEIDSASHLEIPVGLEVRGQNGRVAASVRRVNAGFIQLSSPVYLLKDTRLYVIFDRQRIEIEVVYCKPESSDRYLIGARMNPEPNGSMRREPRLPLDLAAKVTAAHLTAPITSRVVDMSRNGMGLTLPFELPVGTSVSVELRYGIAIGEVRHCTEKSPGVWRVGLWMEEFVPRHEITAPLQRTEETLESAVPKFMDRIKNLFRHS